MVFVFKPSVSSSKPPLRLHASPPLLLFDPAGSPHLKNVVFQGAAHGTGSDVAMLLRPSFAGGDKDESDSDESDEGDIRTNDMKENS